MSNPAEWAGYTAPEGMLLAWRAVHPDGRSSNDFYWPFKGVARVPKRGIVRGNTGPCPKSVGDGLCLAKTWQGAASGGIPAITGLVVAYSPEDILGEDLDKLRVSRCRVLGVLDLLKLLREGHRSGANLTWADLRGANLRGADLRGANLSGADLTWANLSGADLRWANLTWADLYRANLYRADLRGANLRWADLTWANLYRADLRGADLRGANLRWADLTWADLTWAIGVPT